MHTYADTHTHKCPTNHHDDDDDDGFGGVDVDDHGACIIYNTCVYAHDMFIFSGNALCEMLRSTEMAQHFADLRAHRQCRLSFAGLLSCVRSPAVVEMRAPTIYTWE